MPAAPTGFVETITAGSPLMGLEWDHDGIDLDRFELLYRKAGSSDPWTRYVIAPAATFGPGPYAASVVSTQDLEWVVRALSATGVPST